MNLAELFIIAVGLSMDAFAVSVCKGLSTSKLKFSNALTVGLYFGIFQALMPVIGYFLGMQFSKYITAFDHWIAFILLAFIGGKMIKESREADSCPDSSLGFKAMFPLAIATSIDALAVGITFAFLNVHILPAAVSIGMVTLLLSMLGVKIGNVFGSKYKSKAELAGGIILILMGIKILLEHLNIINF